MAIDIFPCPFCGSHHLHIAHYLLTHGVNCESCEAQGPRRRQIEEAVLEWNETSRQLQQAQMMKEHLFTRNKFTNDKLRKTEQTAYNYQTATVERLEKTEK